MSDRSTSFARAAAGYDDEFRRRLADAITTAIAETSLVTDANVMAIRTGETRDALIDCLITVMSMSPHYDVPSHLREFAEYLAKKIRRDVARYRADPRPRPNASLAFARRGEHERAPDCARLRPARSCSAAAQLAGGSRRQASLLMWRRPPR
jgi:hypothetical protein